MLAILLKIFCHTCISTHIFSAPPTSVHLLNDGAEVVEGGDVVAVAGKGLVLECRAQGGNPPPALRWTIGGVLR